MIPQTSQSSHQEALLCAFEDNEAVIKMVIKGRSPTMRHVTELRLIGHLTESTCTSKTKHVLSHGFGDMTGGFREYIEPRDDPCTEIRTWIGGHTKIWPVLQLRNVRCALADLNTYGIDIQILSMSGDGWKSWVVISRSPNRYVDELHYNDPDSSPKSDELANQKEHWGNSYGTARNAIESNERPFRIF